jgi:hypothetical protein
MRLTIELTAEELIALRRFFYVSHTSSLEEATALALREFLIGTGHLELAPSIDVDSEVQGTA